MGLVIPRSALENHYVDYDLDGAFCIAHKSITDPQSLCTMVTEGISHQRYGIRKENLFVKELGTEELGEARLPRRFLNAIMIDSKFTLVTPRPLAFVYDGSAYDLLSLKPNARGYCVTDFVEGEQLQLAWEDLSRKERTQVLGFVRYHLKRLRNKNIYLMDFAPRDIVLDGLHPWFVDTEHVEYPVLSNNHEGLIKKQVKQFRNDWRDYLSRRQLREQAKILEGVLE